MGVSPLKTFLLSTQKYWSGSRRNRSKAIAASKAARREAANEAAQQQAAANIASGNSNEDNS